MKKFSTFFVKAYYTTSAGKSDVLKLKKCVKVLPSFTNREANLIELTAYFQENVPRNEATLRYANETTVVIQLREGGIHK